MPLSDGSFEILVLAAEIEDVVSRLRDLKGSEITVDYDPRQPTEDSICCLGYDWAKEEAIKAFLGRVPVHQYFISKHIREGIPT